MELRAKLAFIDREFQGIFLFNYDTQDVSIHTVYAGSTALVFSVASWARGGDSGPSWTGCVNTVF